MPTTTARGFPIPLADGSDPPNVHTDRRNLGIYADEMFITVANPGSLPAFGKVGRQAYVGSTGDTYLDIGTAWVNQTSREVAGVNGGGAVRRGKTNIAASESRSNTAYGL